MKYETELIIELPRERVIELFDDPDNLSQWQPGLKSFEHISGEAGQPGTKSKLLYEMGSRTVEMIETIEKRELPDEFTSTYEAKGVWNYNANRFYEDGPDKTRWVLDTDFRFSGFMKLMAFFMPGSFKKETMKTMMAFKRFAEQNR
jgi:carbon monoxide dehydrogenase subunit G